MASGGVGRPSRCRDSWRRRVSAGASAASSSLRHVAFWSDQICERGTEVALYDYCDGAESQLGVCAHVLYDAASVKNDAGAVAKFAKRFGSRLIGCPNGWLGVDQYLAASPYPIRVLYCIKIDNDGRVSRLPSVRTCIHQVFDAGEPYGDVYAKISPCVPGACPVVPHIVRPGEAVGADDRAALGIPADATVFGRYGGYESFDVEAAREAVIEVAKRRRDVYFLFMNTPPFAEEEPEEEGEEEAEEEAEEGEVERRRRGRRSGFLSRIIHVEKTSSDEAKSRFIRTCDAMLHGRSSGETFGLAIAEFSSHNRPILTSRDHTDDGTASFHLETLKGKGLYYSTTSDLVALLMSFDRRESQRRDHNAYRAFAPELVMRTFETVFLADKVRPPVPEWKRWRRKHGGGAGGGGGGGLEPRGGAGSSNREASRAEFERRRRVLDELGKLRGLPAEEEEEEVAAGVKGDGSSSSSSSCSYRVVAADGVCMRLAPSLSAASVGDRLSCGARLEAVAVRGAWLRLQDPKQRPRWVLVRHPEEGQLIERQTRESAGT